MNHKAKVENILFRKAPKTVTDLIKLLNWLIARNRPVDASIIKSIKELSELLKKEQANHNRPATI